MSDVYEPNAEPKKRGLPGCVIFGCGAMVVCAILVGVLIYAGVRVALNFRDQWTQDHPIPFPPSALSSDEQQKVRDRFEAFRDGVKEGKEVDPLVLDSDDINALIADDPEAAQRIHVSIVGDKVKGQLSIPLDAIGFKGRYLNGECLLKASMENGVLIVTPDSVTVGGKPIPDDLIGQLRQQNLAAKLYEKPENAAAVRRLESLEVKDGKLVVRARKPEADKESEEKAEPDSAKSKAEPEKDKAEAPKDKDKAQAKEKAEDKARQPDQPPAPEPKASAPEKSGAAAA